METYKRDAEGVWLVQLTPDSDEYVFKKSARGNWGYMNKAEEERKRLQKEEEERERQEKEAREMENRKRAEAERQARGRHPNP